MKRAMAKDGRIGGVTMRYREGKEGGMKRERWRRMKGLRGNEVKGRNQEGKEGGKKRERWRRVEQRVVGRRNSSES